MNHSIALDGTTLNIQKLWDIAQSRARVDVASHCRLSVERSRKFIEHEAVKKVLYGVNTGFGPMASYIMSNGQIRQLQHNLIRSHAVGMGHALPPAYVRAIMATRLNTLIQGFSGVRWDVVKQLQLFLNRDITPIIPEHGAVGTSGDLVQLAHVALALMGEGEVEYHGRRQRTSALLKRLKISPIHLETKEGLALINGTSSMTGIAALLCVEAQRLYMLVVSAAAWGYELLRGYSDAFSARLQSVRPHPGQIHVARDLRALLVGSRMIRKRRDLQKSVVMNHDDIKKIPDKVQDVYSLRCAPQIIGPVYDTIVNASSVVERELNSVTDNPIIFVSHQETLHGGNFHGDYVSLEMDKLKIALAKLAILSERRINLFLNHKVNEFLSPFLNLRKVGLNLALQGIQFVATSTTAEIQTLCFPNYIHSISTNADNQDVVSMGTNSALITAKVIEDIFQVFAIEYLTLTQAVDVLKVQRQLAASSRALYTHIRKIVPAITEDRDMTREIPRLYELVRRGLPLNSVLSR